MKSFILLSAFVFVTSAYAAPAQGLVLTNGNTGVRVRFPNAAPWNDITSWRIEFRMHSCTAGGILFQGPLFRVLTDCQSVGIISWPDNSQSLGVAFAPGATDVVIRAQRIPATHQLSLEVWNAAGGGYSSSFTTDQPLTSHVDISVDNFWWGYITSWVCDYFRFFSQTVPLGTLPSSNPGGDIGDWEFDGNFTDASGHGNNAVNDSASFLSTPLYAPVVSFSPASNCFLSSSYPLNFCTVAVGSTAGLVSTSYSPNLNDRLSYSWKQVSGPVTTTISNSKSANTTALGLSTFGEYDYQLTVTDSEGNSTSETLAVGAVTVSASNNCLVTTVPSQISFILGPLTPWGSSNCDPWPWFDVAEAANAIELQSQFSPPASGRTTNPGTITVGGAFPGPGIYMTGSGTHFTTDCAGMPPNLAPNAPSCQGAMIAIRWNADGVAGSGWSIQVIETVVDDTHASFYGGYKYYPPGPYAGMKYSVIDPNDFYTPFALAVNGQGGSYNWNYYDNVVAFYRMYYRTGIKTFLNHARILADAWYLYALDHGYSNVNVPRLLGIPGLMVRALDGHPEYWNGIQQKIGLFGNGTPPPGDFDPREVGYDTSYVALAAKLDPDAGQRATFCASTVSAIQSFWAPQQLPNGGFWTNMFAINQNYPSVGQGVEPWQLAISANGFKDAYRVLSDPTACNNPSVANQALSMTGRLLTFIYEYGGGGTRTIPAANGGGTGVSGIFYMVGYTASGESPTNGYGTVSGNAGDSTITGNGTNFTQQFQCNGNDYISIGSAYELHQVVSCQSPTSLTIADRIGNSFSNSGYQVSPVDSNTNCQPSKSAVCFGGGNPDDATVLPAIYGWYYNVTGNAQFKVWGDDWFSAAYGGSAGGPGTSGPPAGPGASGNTTGSYGYISALPPCSSSAPPCGGLGGPIGHHWGKDFGIGSGYVGAGANYLAYRLAAPCSTCASHQ